MEVSCDVLVAFAVGNNFADVHAACGSRPIVVLYPAMAESGLTGTPSRKAKQG